MQMEPRVFWRMTLAEWRCVRDGYQDRVKRQERSQAWLAMHTLTAAGCKDVTVAKLLGEPEPKTRRRIDPQEKKRRDAMKIWERMQKESAKKAEAEHGE